MWGGKRGTRLLFAVPERPWVAHAHAAITSKIPPVHSFLSLPNISACTSKPPAGIAKEYIALPGLMYTIA